VYNEATVVDGVIETIHKEFSNVICVDDGSADDSAKVIQASGATLVQHPFNLGAGAATQTGIDYALQDPKAEYFITIDADGQHDVKDAVKMLGYLKEHKLDVVFGSRFMGEVQNISAFKRFFLKIAAIFSKNTTGVNLTDPHIGLRVFNRKFAENLNITLPDFTHASEVIHRTGEGGYSYAEYPVTVTYSDYSKSKGQPMLNAINISVDLLFHRISKK
jgi:glycosyltransferase involved in cell wall biosynthesis